jgi:hypothetical protein
MIESQVQLLGGQQRESRAQVEAHLPAEHRARTGAGTVCLGGTVFEDVPHQVEILLHVWMPVDLPRRIVL